MNPAMSRDHMRARLIPSRSHLTITDQNDDRALTIVNLGCCLELLPNGATVELFPKVAREIAAYLTEFADTADRTAMGHWHTTLGTPATNDKKED